MPPASRHSGTPGAGPKHALAGVRSDETAPDVLQSLKRALKPRKYRNEPVTIGGMRFDSRKEAGRYADLLVREKLGEIRDLECHPRFPLVVHEQDCGVYVADFGYIVTATDERVIEDVKSDATRKLPTYRLKRRLVWAVYGLAVKEV